MWYANVPMGHSAFPWLINTKFGDRIAEASPLARHTVPILAHHAKLVEVLEWQHLVYLQKGGGRLLHSSGSMLGHSVDALLFETIGICCTIAEPVIYNLLSSQHRG